MTASARREENPYERDAEVAVLGAILLDNSCAHEILRLLGPRDFYLEAHQRIFAAMANLLEDGRPVDAVLLSNALLRTNELEVVGGKGAIVEIMEKVPTAAHAIHYAEIVAATATRRRLIAYASIVDSEARAEGADVTSSVVRARDAMDRLLREQRGADVRQFLTCADIKKRAPSTVPWILRGIIAEGMITLLSGKPKGGKSLWTYALLEALERGLPFIGLPTSAVDTVFVSEEPDMTIREKIERFGLERTHFYTREQLFPLRPFDDVVEHAAAHAKKIGAKLLIFDTFRAWAGLAKDMEKDSGAVQQAMRPLVRVAQQQGLAVLLIHHAKKGESEEGEAASGSNALTGAVEIVVELHRRPEPDRKYSGERLLVVQGRTSESPQEPMQIVLRGNEYLTVEQAQEVAPTGTTPGDGFISILEAAGGWMPQSIIDRIVPKEDMRAFAKAVKDNPRVTMTKGFNNSNLWATAGTPPGRGGNIAAALVALEAYYSGKPTSDRNRWRKNLADERRLLGIVDPAGDEPPPAVQRALALPPPPEPEPTPKPTDEEAAADKGKRRRARPKANDPAAAAPARTATPATGPTTPAETAHAEEDPGVPDTIPAPAGEGGAADDRASTGPGLSPEVAPDDPGHAEAVPGVQEEAPAEDPVDRLMKF